MQRCSLGQRVGAGRAPNVATIVPLALANPLPLSTSVSPAAPVSGSKDESTGPLTGPAGLVVAVVFGIEVGVVRPVLVVVVDRRVDWPRPRRAATCLERVGPELESATPTTMPAKTTTVTAITKRNERRDPTCRRARLRGTKMGAGTRLSADMGPLDDDVRELEGSSISGRCRAPLISPSVSIALW
ncbi:MAG: hypothetical protein WCF24_03420 [Acidimicrobiales bacterium]